MKQQDKPQRAGIVIAGGGASGLMAAVSAAQELERQGRRGRILVLEAAQRVGKKLLATGNGRCNLTNREAALAHYHGGAKELAQVLEQCPPSQVLRVFERFGLLCRTETQGRVYPYNVQASAVLEILRLQLERYGVEIRCEFPIAAIQKQPGGFLLTVEDGRQVLADTVVLALGGKASPQLGSNGSGFALASQLGHRVTLLVPALSGVKTEPHRAKPLKGMRSYGVASLWMDGEWVREEAGEVQFTEYGLSGICVFQLSRHIHAALQEKPSRSVEVCLDLMPEYEAEFLAKKIAGHAKQYPDLPGTELLSGMVNQRVGQEIVRLTLGKLPAARAVSFSDCRDLAQTIKRFSFPIVGQGEWKSAQVTAGGVDCTQVHPKTLESRRCPGLYFAGEILDVDGDCGGFNLHWAWVSGMLAGRCAAETWLQGGNKR